MPKDKERTLNPAAVARKAEKDKAKKKGKATVLAQRNERLARQNPARLERQIADLRSQEQSEGKISARDRKLLEELERDVSRIKKARETSGVKDQPRDRPRDQGDRNGHTQNQDGRDQHGTKRRWDDRDGASRRQNDHSSSRRQNGHSSGSETDESVRKIPMPRDTPPPVPHRRRREDGLRQDGRRQGDHQQVDQREPNHTAAPAVESKTVYEAKPIVKDLRKEATGFVPAAVKRKIDATKGAGGRLLEAEELDRLEAQGYGVNKGAEKERSVHVQMEEVEDEDL